MLDPVCSEIRALLASPMTNDYVSTPCGHTGPEKCSRSSCTGDMTRMMIPNLKRESKVRIDMLTISPLHRRNRYHQVSQGG